MLLIYWKLIAKNTVLKYFLKVWIVLCDANLPRNQWKSEFGGTWIVPLGPTKKSECANWAKRPIQRHAYTCFHFIFYGIICLVPSMHYYYIIVLLDLLCVSIYSQPMSCLHNCEMNPLNFILIKNNNII